MGSSGGAHAGAGAGSGSGAADGGAAAAAPGPASLVALPEHAAYCLDVIIADLEGRPPPPPTFDTTPEAPFFVTLNIQSRRGYILRGCIGTLSPRPLADLARFARSSAFKDRRFEPVELREVPKLSCGVSLLVNYEDGSDAFDWTVGTHGILIHFTVDGQEYSATYLPEVAREQGWTREEALASLIAKAGYRGVADRALLAAVRLTRYQSSKTTLYYADYLKMRGE